jgi:hypothetical protein
VDFFLRFTLTMTTLIAVTVGLAFARPAWMEDMGMDFWNLAECEKLIHKEKELSNKLDNQRLQTLAINERKNQILQETIDGKRTLADAVRRIEEISGEEFMEEACRILEIEHSTQSGRFHNLIWYWIEKRMNDDPTIHRQVRVRLEMEFRQMNVKGKTVKV